MTLRALLHGKSWTPETDEQLKSLWDSSSKTIAQLAGDLNRSHSSIAARLVKLCLVPNRMEARRISSERQKNKTQ